MIWPRLVLAALAGVASDLCGLFLVAASAWLIARAAQQPPIAALGLAIVGVRAFAIGNGSIRYLERILGHDVALRMVAEVRGRVFDRLARRRAAARDADDVNRMVSDVDAVQDLLLRCLLPLASATVSAVAGLAVCRALLPAAALVLLGAVALTAALAGVAAVLARGHACAISAARVALSARTLDLTEGAADLVAFGAAGRATAAANDAAHRLGLLQRRAGRLTFWSEAAGFVVAAGSVLGVCLLAIGSGTGTVATAVLALTTLVALQLAFPAVTAAKQLTESLPGARRVRELLREPPAEPGGSVRPDGPGALRLVRVGVHRDGVPALREVDMTVAPGRRIAVVGASGAGKSTLLGTLSGALAPQRGSVLLDGRPLADYADGAVRGQFQDAHVFTATVRANLALARPGATEEQLELAAARARFSEVVVELPDGWDTVVGDGGRRLSGGQRQRLLLARALLADPPVLLLDEPTENLDPETADAILGDLLGSPSGRSLVVVTHRLAPLALADEILVLDRGAVIQRGRHDDLAGRPGAYRDLWLAETATGTHRRPDPAAR